MIASTKRGARRGDSVYPSIVSLRRKRPRMFDKTILDMWFDDDSFHMFLISVDDKGTLFLTEREPERVR